MSTEAEQKQEILDWVGAVTGEPIPKDTFEKVLKDGVLLAKLINKLIPGYIKKINTKGGNFALMENLAAVQKGMREYGVPEDELFQPVDLFEARNIKAVVKSLSALARTCLNKGFEGPAFGPKMSAENKREFSEEQLRAGRDGQIGLQMGSNKGATQADLTWANRDRCMTKTLHSADRNQTDNSPYSELRHVTDQRTGR